MYISTYNLRSIVSILVVVASYYYMLFLHHVNNLPAMAESVLKLLAPKHAQDALHICSKAQTTCMHLKDTTHYERSRIMEKVGEITSHFSYAVGDTTNTTTRLVIISASAMKAIKMMLPLLAGNLPRMIQC